MSSVYSVALYRPVNDDDISRYENNIKRLKEKLNKIMVDIYALRSIIVKELNS